MPRVAQIGAPRPRDTTTCTSCRARKLKCDKAKPVCERCARDDIQCVYESMTRSKSYTFVEANLAAGQQSSSSASQEPSSREEFVPVSDKRLQAIEELLASLQQDVSYIRQNSREKPSNALPSEPADSPSGTSGGHLTRVVSNKVRYVHEGFWAYIQDDVGELEQLLIDEEISRQGSPLAMTTRTEQSPSYDIAGDLFVKSALQPVLDPLKGLGSHLLDTLVADLPSKERCDALIQNYIKGYFPVVPLFHLPTFINRYELLFARLRHGDRLTESDVSFMALLYAVFYTGSTITICMAPNDEQVTRDENEASRLYCENAALALRYDSFPRSASLETLAAYTMCNAPKFREEEPLTCLAFIGTCIRIAYVLGLHQDPDTLSSQMTITPIIAEERRRAWYNVVHMDVLFSTASGVPPMLSPSQWSVKEPCELKEELIGTPEGRQYLLEVEMGLREPEIADDPAQAPRSMVAASMIMAIGKRRTSVAIGEILRILHKHATQTPDSVLQIRRQLERIRLDIQSRLSRIPRASTDHDAGPRYPCGTFELSHSSHALNGFARVLLSFQNNRPWCILSNSALTSRYNSYLPLLFSRVMDNASSFLEKILHITVTAPYRPFHWAYPGINQPLNALFPLLKDLELHPTSPRAVRQRTLIDLTFALCAPDGGIVGGTSPIARPLLEGGQESWKLLLRMRYRSWRSCGEDPTSLWSRERAIEVARGFAGDDDIERIEPVFGREELEGRDEGMVRWRADRSAGHKEAVAGEGAMFVEPTEFEGLMR